MDNIDDLASRVPKKVQKSKIINNKGWIKRLIRRFKTSSDKKSDDILKDASSDKEPTNEMLVNLRNLQTLTLDDISIPKADIVAMAEDSSYEDVIEVFRTSSFTRVPIYSDTLDSPLGLIHLKDFALGHGFGSSKTFNIRTLLRPLLYVPPSMRLGTLLQRMKAERIHMALVIDEYGGVESLVTIEDLLEQIVGDIVDEHDAEEDQLWVEERPGVYLVHARLGLEDFYEQTGVDLRDPEIEEEEYDTIGGLVFSITKRIPVRGEVIRDKYNNEFNVVDADPRRIKRLRVNMPKEAKNHVKAK